MEDQCTDLRCCINQREEDQLVVAHTMQHRHIRHQKWNQRLLDDLYMASMGRLTKIHRLDGINGSCGS